jgi:hypothetical protein
MPDASDPGGAQPVNRIVDPRGLTPLMQALKWADRRRRSLDPEGTIVSDDHAELLDRRGWYFTAYQLTREYVEANKNPLEIKEIFKALSGGDEAMRAIAFKAIEDAWFGSAFDQGLPPLPEPSA